LNDYANDVHHSRSIFESITTIRNEDVGTIAPQLHVNNDGDNGDNDDDDDDGDDDDGDDGDSNDNDNGRYGDYDDNNDNDHGLHENDNDGVNDGNAINQSNSSICELTNRLRERHTDDNRDCRVIVECTTGGNKRSQAIIDENESGGEPIFLYTRSKCAKIESPTNTTGSISWGHAQLPQSLSWRDQIDPYPTQGLNNDSSSSSSSCSISNSSTNSSSCTNNSSTSSTSNSSNSSNSSNQNHLNSTRGSERKQEGNGDSIHEWVSTEWNALQVPSLTPIWGEDHPSFRKMNVQRVQWSPQELTIIDKEVNNILSDNNGHRPYNLNILVTHSIWANREYYPIFHQHHVQDANVMRNGIRAMETSRQKIHKSITP